MNLPFELKDPLEVKAAKFLKDLVDFYGKDPLGRRSVGVVICRYKTEDGERKCAIGRYIPDKVYNLRMESTPPELVIKKLPKEIQKLGVDFLQECQVLHDRQSHWNLENGGLSQEGKQKVRKMIVRYNLPNLF